MGGQITVRLSKSVIFIVCYWHAFYCTFKIYILRFMFVCFCCLYFHLYNYSTDCSSLCLHGVILASLAYSRKLQQFMIVPFCRCSCWNVRRDERRFSKVEQKRRNWRKNRRVSQSLQSFGKQNNELNQLSL